MNLLVILATPFLQLFKKLVHLTEIKKFQDAVHRNPQDDSLRARFVKYCLHHYFNDDSSSKLHAREAVNQFEGIVRSDVSDLEVFYLMGKFFQGQGNSKAVEAYREGLRRYNRFAEKSHEFKREGEETAFAIAMNLLKLEPVSKDPELDRFLRNIRQTYLANFFSQRPNVHAPSVQTGEE